MNPLYLRHTQLLDFHHAEIRKLLKVKEWSDLCAFDRIGRAYNFVRDEIAFGYNHRDNISASSVLVGGYGQCNTKATLLMALLRALGIPCRLHGFTICKSLQRGIVPELVFALAPDNILHSWVEVWYDDRWINLEGFILDGAFLQSLQKRFVAHGETLCAYGVGTDCLSAPPINWLGSDTYIQRTGINADFGIFDCPDVFYAVHKQNFSWPRGVIYRYIVRHWMNRRVGRIRRGLVPEIPNNQPDV